jgi:hypothetical protein
MGVGNGHPQQHMPAPANLQPMYEFRHGTFTKFQGTSPNLAPRPVSELPPPALSTRAHGQPQLAPKPSPDPRDGTAGISPGGGPHLAPKPHMHGPPPPVSPLPPTHHSGFKPINEPRVNHSTPPRGPVHVAPKQVQELHDISSNRPSEGARQLAPKPAQQPTREEIELAEGVVTRRQAAAGSQPRPTTPQHSPQVQQSQSEAMSGAEAEAEAEENSKMKTRGNRNSFHQVVMS